MVQRVCAHVTGLPKAAEAGESLSDKMFGGGSDKGKSLVALKEEAADRRRMLQRATQEAGGLYSLVFPASFLLVDESENCERVV